VETRGRCGAAASLDARAGGLDGGPRGEGAKRPIAGWRARSREQRHRQRRRSCARHSLPQGLHRVQRRTDRRTARAVHGTSVTAFRDAESYYATLAHETTHWTAHESRLARDFGTKRFGSEGYAIEELVAELGAAFLCADLDLMLEPREDHAAYIANWLEVLKSDNRAIFTAASHAQRAADFINGLQPASAG
jgi:hypothetical protein